MQQNMANEMGNQNSSDLQEEDYTQNRASNEYSVASNVSIDADGAQVDNGTVPPLDTKDVCHSQAEDHQIQEQSTTEKEKNDETRTSNPHATSTDSKPVLESVKPKSDEGVYTGTVSAEYSTKENTELQQSINEITVTKTDNGDKLKDDATTELDGIVSPKTSLEADNNETDMTMKETEPPGREAPDINDAYDKNSEALDKIEEEEGSFETSIAQSSVTGNEVKQEPTESDFVTNDPIKLASHKSMDTLNPLSNHSEIKRLYTEGDHNLLPVKHGEEPVDQSNVDRNDRYEAEFMVTGSDHENQEGETDEPCDYGAKKASQIDSSSRSIPDDQNEDLEEAEMIEIATALTDFIVRDINNEERKEPTNDEPCSVYKLSETNDIKREVGTDFMPLLDSTENSHEEIMQKIEDSDSLGKESEVRMEQTNADKEAVEPVSSQLDLIEHETAVLQPCSFPQDHSQPPNQLLDLTESEIHQQIEGNSSPPNEDNHKACDVSECSETLTQTEVSPIKSTEQSSGVSEGSKFDSQIRPVQTSVSAVEPHNDQSQKEELEQKLVLQEINKEEGEAATIEGRKNSKESNGQSDQNIVIPKVDDKRNFSSYVEKLDTETKVSALEAENEETEHNQLLHPATTTEKIDVSEKIKEKKICIFETTQEFTKEVDVNGSFAEAKDLEPEASKEYTAAPTLLHEKISVGSCTSAPEKTDSEKLGAPCVVQPLQKQQSPVEKKVLDEARKSPAKKTIDTSPKVSEKHQKPRSSFFSSCICCTAVIQ